MEEKTIVKKYKANMLLAIGLVFVLMLGFITISYFNFSGFASMQYNEAYEEAYEHQVEYYMNKPNEQDDLYEPDDVAKCISVTFVPSGELLMRDGIAYYNEYKLIIKNVTGKELEGAQVQIPYIDYNTAGYSVRMGQMSISANEDVKLITFDGKYVKPMGFIYFRASESLEYGICYETYSYTEQLSYSDAKKLVNEDIVLFLAGEKPNPWTANNIFTCLPLFVVCLCLIALVIYLVKKAVVELKDIKAGRYSIKLNQLVLDRNAHKIRMSNLEINSELDAQKDNDSTTDAPQFDYDDGHKTDHECGSVDINPDDYKIDNSDY